MTLAELEERARKEFPDDWAMFNKELDKVIASDWVMDSKDPKGALRGYKCLQIGSFPRR